jgi:hypothetical protein
MLFRETVAVYCENHTKHKYALWAENSVRTSQKAYFIPATKPNRLMLFRKTVAVKCEGVRNTQIHSLGTKLTPYLTGNTLRLIFKENSSGN